MLASLYKPPSAKADLGQPPNVGGGGAKHSLISHMFRKKALRPVPIATNVKMQSLAMLQGSKEVKVDNVQLGQSL